MGAVGTVGEDVVPPPQAPRIEAANHDIKVLTRMARVVPVRNVSTAIVTSSKSRARPGKGVPKRLVSRISSERSGCYARLITSSTKNAARRRGRTWRGGFTAKQLPARAAQGIDVSARRDSSAAANVGAVFAISRRWAVASPRVASINVFVVLRALAAGFGFPGVRERGRPVRVYEDDSVSFFMDLRVFVIPVTPRAPLLRLQRAVTARGARRGAPRRR